MNNCFSTIQKYKYNANINLLYFFVCICVMFYENVPKRLTQKEALIFKHIRFLSERLMIGNTHIILHKLINYLNQLKIYYHQFENNLFPNLELSCTHSLMNGKRRFCLGCYSLKVMLES